MKKCFSLVLALGSAFSIAAPSLAQGSVRNGLPPVMMDSFVYNAAGNAELIYGDEGANGLPPYNEFTYDHRINNGITGTNDKGLTTGHGSVMPSAWGNDEFVGAAEWSRSGTNNGNPNETGGTQNSVTGAGGDPGGAPPVGTAPSDASKWINAGWQPVYDSNHNLMGYMAPGETYDQFYSGSSGHIWSKYVKEGQTYLAKDTGGTYNQGTLKTGH